jgi:nitrate/nitrite transporter NarK
MRLARAGRLRNLTRMTKAELPTTSSSTRTERQGLAWRRHLAVGTGAFFVCFVGWGVVAGLATQLRLQFHLDGSQTALLVAVPVLLGALARLPLGIAADRLGGRWIFTALMLVAAVPMALLPTARSFGALVGFAFLLGVAGASFAVGVSYVSRWVPAALQGTALGIYGLGNLGQSAAVFLGPLASARFGWPTVFHGVAAVLACAAVAFALLARDAGPRRKSGGEIGAALREPKAWTLAAFYFVTFGGFVAFSVYLPTLLRDSFRLTTVNAGFRAAGFVLLTTLCRPVGGALADRIGGARVLRAVFLSLVPFTCLLAWQSMVPFTVGALGCAVLMGLGNGAVFKLVPEHFPRGTGTVTGLVGALGGLGGFFPPLLLGFLRDHLGVIWPGFLLLGATAFGLLLLNERVFVAAEEAREAAALVGRRAADRLRAGSVATVATAFLVAAIVIGSRKLANFDAALVVYTFAVVFAGWGTVYHYAVWLQKPPTRRYWQRGWRLLREQPVLPLLVRAGRTVVTHIFAQTFIARRSRTRWWAHQLIFWGCLLAVAITFPLVFGWVHFRTAPEDPQRYIAYLFGFPAGSFPLGTPVAWFTFHGLDVAAVLVLGGIALALGRRLGERGALAVQTFDRDFFPLILLFAVSVTGLALTVSTMWLRAAMYPFLALVHAITVIATLLYLPFGKLFHIVQRPAQIGVKLYQEAGAARGQAVCPRCREPFASAMQIADLREVLGELGFDYRLPTEAGPTEAGPTEAGHWQALCPRCKRRSVASAQLRLTGRPRPDVGTANPSGTHS